MDLLIDESSYVVFDLDDTLYPERGFVQSAFRHIAKAVAADGADDAALEMMKRFDRREDVFDWAAGAFQLPTKAAKAWLLHEYRTHSPTLALGDGAAELLEGLRNLGVPMGLMTDGRSITQRNKIAALGLEPYLTDIIISEEFGSEKPDPRNYRFFADRYPGRRFVFIGDNTRKDFIVPAELGWTTICLKCSGWNIHPQDLTANPRPDHIVSSLREIRLALQPTAS